jgi:hypothetical protein
MSGFLKSVGKVFQKIVNNPIVKVVAIAAAVYFTGGLALGALGGEVGAFAASLPGISAAADTLGITAGAFGTAATEAAAATANAALASAGFGESIGMTAEEAAAAATGPFQTATGLAEGVAGTGEAAAGTAAQTFPLEAQPAVTGTDTLGQSAANATANTAQSATNAGLNAQQAFDPNAMGNELGTTSGGQGTGVTGQPMDPNALGNELGTTSSGGSTAQIQASSPYSGSSTSPVTGRVGSPDALRDAAGNFQTAGGPATLDGQSTTNPLSAAWDWFKNADPLTQKMLLQGISDAGKGALGAIGQQQQNAERRYEFDTLRGDKARMGQTYDLSAVYKKPSIINTGSMG